MFSVKMIFNLFFLLTNVYAGNTGDELPLVGGTRDVNNCLVSAGYTWCQSSQNCLRQWEISC